MARTPMTADESSLARKWIARGDMSSKEIKYRLAQNRQYDKTAGGFSNFYQGIKAPTVEGLAGAYNLLTGASKWIAKKTGISSQANSDRVFGDADRWVDRQAKAATLKGDMAGGFSGNTGKVIGTIAPYVAGGFAGGGAKLVSGATAKGLASGTAKKLTSSVAKRVAGTTAKRSVTRQLAKASAVNLGITGLYDLPKQKAAKQKINIGLQLGLDIATPFALRGLGKMVSPVAKAVTTTKVGRALANSYRKSFAPIAEKNLSKKYYNGITVNYSELEKNRLGNIAPDVLNPNARPRAFKQYIYDEEADMFLPKNLDDYRVHIATSRRGGVAAEVSDRAAKLVQLGKRGADHADLASVKRANEMLDSISGGSAKNVIRNYGVRNKGTVLKKLFGTPGRILAKLQRKVDIGTNMNIAKFMNPRIKNLKLKLNEPEWTELTKMLDTGVITRPLKQKESELLNFLKEGYAKMNAEYKNLTGEVLGLSDNFAPKMLRADKLEYLLEQKNFDKVLKQVKDLNPSAGKDDIDSLIAGYKKDYTGLGSGKTTAEFERKGLKLPDEWFENNLVEAYETYTRNMSHRLAAIENFGYHNEIPNAVLKSVSAVNNTMPDVNSKVFADMFKQLFKRTPAANAVRMIKNANSVKLVFSSAISNIADLVSTAVAGGGISTMLKGTAAITHDSSVRAVLRNMDLLGDMARASADPRVGGKFAERMMKWGGFTASQRATDKINVATAVQLLKKTAKRLGKRGTALDLKYMEMMLSKKSAAKAISLVKAGKPLTKDLMTEAGIGFMQRTRPVGFMDVPFMFDATKGVAGGIAQLGLQYKRWNVSVGNVVKSHIWDNLMSNDLGMKARGAKNLVNLAIMAVATQELAGLGKDKLNRLYKYAGAAMIGETPPPAAKEEIKHWVEKIIGDISDVGSFGVVGDFASSIVNGARMGNATSVLGMTASDAWDVVSGGVKMGFLGTDALGLTDNLGKDPKSVITQILGPVPILKKLSQGVFQAKSRKIKPMFKTTKKSTLSGAINNIFMLARKSLPLESQDPRSWLVRDAYSEIKQMAADLKESSAANLLVGADPNETELYGKSANGIKLLLESGYGKMLRIKRWVDGDTIEFEDGSRLRVPGIDTAEISNSIIPEEYGVDATVFGKELAPEGSDVLVQRDISSGGFDFSGRDIGTVTTKEGLNVGNELVRSGLSKENTDYRYDRNQGLLDAQEEAKNKGLRMWSK